MARWLSIVHEAYRATIEEQDDTAVWFTMALRGAGAEISLLLRGDAVNYAVPGQDAGGLRFGTRTVRVPPRLEADLAALIAKEVPVYVHAEDAAERGLTESGLLPGIRLVAGQGLGALVAGHDRILHW
jgi:hypothetical protein